MVQQGNACCKAACPRSNNGGKSMAYSNGQDENACSCMDGGFLRPKPASRRASFCPPQPEWTLIQVTFLSHMVSLLIISVSTLC